MAVRVYPHLAIFGNTRIYRGNCPKCNDFVLFPSGTSACCGVKPPKPPRRLEVVVPPHRRKPSEKTQAELLEKFDQSCAYCQNPFGSLVHRRDRSTQLRLVWDHFVPYSVSGDSSDENFVPACQLCNSLKRDLWFQSVEEARSYIVRRLAKNGVRLLPQHLPPNQTLATILPNPLPTDPPRQD